MTQKYIFVADASPKMVALVKKVGVRVSPNFIHTLSISRDLWNGWKCDSPMPWRVTAPFIICNNTDNSITCVFFNCFGSSPYSEYSMYLATYYLTTYLRHWENYLFNIYRFGQEGSTETVILFPFECYLYAWYDPVLPKSLKITVLMNATYEVFI